MIVDNLAEKVPEFVFILVFLLAIVVFLQFEHSLFSVDTNLAFFILKLAINGGNVRLQIVGYWVLRKSRKSYYFR